ncbi:MAG: RNA pseudouridine synthase [Simkaniaceae bacterium]
MRNYYLDNHLFIVEKEAGRLTQEDGRSKHSLENDAKKFIKEKFQKPGRVFLHPVHRLDKPVSGLVIFARSSKALARLNEAQRERKIEKRYLALIEGKMPGEKGNLKNLISHQSHRAHIGEGKEAELFYRVVKKKEGLQLVEIQLVTGRYHQIRAQLAEVGCPIVGDKKYGSRIKANRIYLHHYFVRFQHPVKDEEIEVKSDTDFTSVFEL